MKQTDYLMKKPTGIGTSGALACASSTISPWAGFGVATATRLQVRHTNGAVRLKGLTEGSTV